MDVSEELTAAAPRPAPPDRLRQRLLTIATLGALCAVTVWAGNRVHFSLVELLGHLGAVEHLIDDSLPPDWGFLPRLARPLLETFQMAIVGTVIGSAIALPLALFAARPIAPSPLVYRASRLAMNLLRTMPDLFWAMLFAAAVGFGAFSGLLALTAFTVAVVSKLLSESAEAIDLGVTEAVRASGGGWSETVRYAVWPQVIPHYVSYALYAFELNIRASTVLGLVGAGGIGVLLKTQLGIFRFDRVALIVLIILAVVLVIEQISAMARRRLA